MRYADHLSHSVVTVYHLFTALQNGKFCPSRKANQATYYVLSYITDITKDIHEPTIECELATLCLEYLTFPCFDCIGPDPNTLERYALEGYFAFQDYAVAKWSHHVTAWLKCGSKFLQESPDKEAKLDTISIAIDDFMARYDEEDWESGLLEFCKQDCAVFEEYSSLYENLVLLISHISTFQKFESRHKISIKSLATAFERNRKVLEDFPEKAYPNKLLLYKQFYDHENLYKCNKITCRYFSDGFKDAKARKRHVDIHDRPYQCEVTDCVGSEGFANPKDLERHNRGFHPEMVDFSKIFNSVTVKRGNAAYACTLCGKTFTRDFHRKHHEMAHRGERPYKCGECSKAFTRTNDLRRHKKLHERKQLNLERCNASCYPGLVEASLPKFLSLGYSQCVAIRIIYGLGVSFQPTAHFGLEGSVSGG